MRWRGRETRYRLTREGNLEAISMRNTEKTGLLGSLQGPAVLLTVWKRSNPLCFCCESPLLCCWYEWRVDNLEGETPLGFVRVGLLFLVA